jgi:hypothetical protein
MTSQNKSCKRFRQSNIASNIQNYCQASCIMCCTEYKMILILAMIAVTFSALQAYRSFLYEVIFLGHVILYMRNLHLVGWSST